MAGSGEAVRAEGDVAFAGAARQAEMVRAGDVSPTELVRLCLDRIARLDPRAERLPRRLRRAGAARGRAGRGAAEGRRGAAAARRADRDQGRSRRRRRDQHARNRRLHRAGRERLRDGAPPARGGRDRRRPHPAAGDGDLRLHRVGDLRRHPQSLEPAAHVPAARAAAAAPRSPPGWCRSPRPATAPARSASPPPAAACSASNRRAVASPWRRSSKAGAASPSTAASAAPFSTPRSGSTSSPAARRSPRRRRRPSAPSSSRRRRRPASCGSPGRPLAPRAALPPTVSEVAKEAVADTAELLGSLGHEVARRDPDWGRIGNHIIARFLRGVADDGRRSAEPRAARTPHARLRPARRACSPTALYERALRQGPGRPTSPGSTRSSTHCDVLITPVMGGTALPVRRWEGRGALRTVLGMSRFYPYCVPWNHLGNPAMSVPAGFAADGMPLAVQIDRPPRRRGDAALARRPARGRAPLGGQAPAAQLTRDRQTQPSSRVLRRSGTRQPKTLRIRASSRRLPRGRMRRWQHHLQRAVVPACVAEAIQSRPARLEVEVGVRAPRPARPGSSRCR